MCHEAGVQPGETTADGKLTLEFAECLGACEFAPCMLAGKTLYKNLTPELGEKFVAQCRAATAQNRPSRKSTDRSWPAVRPSSAHASSNGHQNSLKVESMP